MLKFLSRLLGKGPRAGDDRSARLRKGRDGKPLEELPKVVVAPVGADGKPDFQSEPSPPIEISAEESAWGVPTWDGRPITHHLTCWSADPQIAQNAVSFSGETGRSFAEHNPPSDRETPCELTYRIDAETLPEGILFSPREMEDKWAIYHRDGLIIVVRSWLRQVILVAPIGYADGKLVIRSIRGSFTADASESDELVIRWFDYLLRSHVLDERFPVPLPPELRDTPGQSGVWCITMFGRAAQFAAFDPIPRVLPERPLRTASDLHIAAASADAEAVRELVAAGVSPECRDPGGGQPIHWAVVPADLAALEALLDLGVDPDAANEIQGATPLMNACLHRNVAAVRLLLERGARSDLLDNAGATALHRAAASGHAEVVRLLLDAGADASLAFQGKSPADLAAERGHTELSLLLQG